MSIEFDQAHIYGCIAKEPEATSDQRSSGFVPLHGGFEHGGAGSDGCRYIQAQIDELPIDHPHKQPAQQALDAHASNHAKHRAARGVLKDAVLTNASDKSARLQDVDDCILRVESTGRTLNRTLNKIGVEPPVNEQDYE